MAAIDARKFLSMHAGWTAINLAQGYMDYKHQLSMGRSKAYAATSAIATVAFYEMFPGVGAALMVGSLIAAGAPAAYQLQRVKSDQWQRRFEPNMGGYFQDSQQAMILRARAAQQIHESHGLARSVLGREARFMR